MSAGIFVIVPQQKQTLNLKETIKQLNSDQLNQIETVLINVVPSIH